MQSLPSTIGAIAVFLFCPLAQAQTLAPFTFLPAQSYDKNAGVLVDVPEEKGQKAVGLRADMGQFGWCSMDLGRTFQMGRYKIEFTLYAANDKAAAVALYAGTGKIHLQITYALTCPVGATQKGEKYFFATEPFSSLVLKKVDTRKTPSVALVKAVLTDMNQREYPRLAAYKKLLSYPAPWGLRDSAIEAKTSRMDCIGEIESWLDRRSKAAELLGRADYLLLAHRLFKCSTSKSEVEQAYGLVKYLKPDTLKSFEKTLDTFQANLEKTLGGTLDPANGTDIFTWIKCWTLAGSETIYDSGEATPYLATYSNDVTIRLMKTGQTVDFKSSWTTNIYTASDMTVTYSVLSPLSVIDLKTNTLSAEISGLTKSRENLAEGWFTLASKGHLYLFITNRQFEKVDCSDKNLNLRLNAPAAVGYLKLPLNLEKKIPALANFYQSLLLHQPVQCVQVQKGDRIEQIFEYFDRPCDRAVKPVVTAPIPHLLSMVLHPSSRLKVTFIHPVRHGPDGWGYVPNTDRIAYTMPKLPRAHSGGTNIWLDLATKADYADLRKQNCKTIRLVLRSEPGWKEMTMEAKKKLVQQNLQWIREVGGLTVGVDMHNEWISDLNTPEGFSNPAVLKEFINRWKAVLVWCEPYRDIIGWYDLMNEPQIFSERMWVRPYWVFMRKAARVLRPHAGKTPFLVECTNMADPGAVNQMEDLGDKNTIIGYHDYWPHMFTHQRGVDGGDEAMPGVFYPSFMPGISWTSPSWQNDSTLWFYWDRWKCNSISLPIYLRLIGGVYRLDCGEYGVVGYAGQTSPLSGTIWLRHALDRFKHLGINHDVWGIHGGFTWYSPQIKEVLFKFWTENK
jgi:hypothetical protein